MIDPGWLGSAAPLIAGVGVGLVARKVIALNDARIERREHDDDEEQQPATATQQQRRAPRLAVPAARR